MLSDCPNLVAMGRTEQSAFGIRFVRPGKEREDFGGIPHKYFPKI